MSRDFGPAFKAAVGGEYAAPVRLFKKEASVPLRFGLVYDQQPMRDPQSAYAPLSFGAGLHFHTIRLDVGGQFGSESGSSRSLDVMRISLSLGFWL